MDTLSLHVDGMSCGGCIVSVEKALRRVAGVRDVKVDLAAKRAEVRGDDLRAEALVNAVVDAGYDASVG